MYITENSEQILNMDWSNNTNFIVFGLTPPGLQPTILCHRCDSVVGFSEQENKAMNKLMRFLFSRL